MKGVIMIEQELFGNYYPEGCETYTLLKEVSEETARAITGFFCEETFKKYNDMTKEKLSVLVYVNSDFFCKVLLHPRIEFSKDSSIGMKTFFDENEAINGFSYKKCFIQLSYVTIVYVCLPFYTKDPVCNIRKVFER